MVVFGLGPWPTGSGPRTVETVVDTVNHYSDAVPGLDLGLTHSQALYERLASEHRARPFDVVDMPLVPPVGLVAAERFRGPVVVALDGRARRATAGAEPGLEGRLLARSHDTYETGAGAEAALAAYQRASAAWQARCAESRVSPSVIQVAESLAPTNAVSSIIGRHAGVIADLGLDPTVYTHLAPSGRVPSNLRAHECLAQPEAGVILHYWGYSHTAWLLWAIEGRRALYYHGITPPDYFATGSATWRENVRGLRQLSELADEFDLVIGDSDYNVAEVVARRGRPVRALTIYPPVDIAELRSALVDQPLLARLRQDTVRNVLFVGRLARNKRQDQVMRAFDAHQAQGGAKARLWLVGSGEADPAYRAELEALRQELPSGGRIMFTGVVPAAALMAYYRAADVFVCASEHEGFCIPIAEAMAFGVPVIALAAAAVPETMGGGGTLLEIWATEAVAATMEQYLTDGDLRAQTLVRQEENVSRFSARSAAEGFRAAVQFLGDGRESPLIQWWST